MKPTIQTIAQVCGVSRGTVDRVLHNRPHVAPEIRERILRTAKELGYAPACDRRTAMSDAVTIAILLPKWTDDYFTRQTYAGVNLAMHSINDPHFRVITRELPSLSLRHYLTAIDELAEQGLSGLILNAANSLAIQVKVDELVTQGIEVVTYDADIPGSKRLCFIGQDLARAGAIAADLMARFMRPREEVLIVTGNMEFISHKGRVDGFVGELRERGFSMSCYTIAECHEQYELTSRTVCEMLRQNENIRHIYMANESVSGCIDGVRRAHLPYEVHIICNDMTPSAKKYLLNRQIDFVIDQTFTQKAFKAITVLYKLLCQGVHPKKDKLFTDSLIITQELL